MEISAWHICVIGSEWVKTKGHRTLQRGFKNILREMATVHGSLNQTKRDRQITHCALRSIYFRLMMLLMMGNTKQILATCGTATFKCIQSFINRMGRRDFLAKKNIVDIVAKMKQHYNPPHSPIVQQFCFNSHICQGGESIATYIATLRELAEHWEYCDSLSAIGQSVELITTEFKTDC